VNRSVPKQTRVRLDLEPYEKLRQRVLQRDCWTCQVCGSKINLQVHHTRFRSRQGNDSEQNLITLCANCHDEIHRSQGMSDMWAK